ncbi:DUF5688 family protein [Butyrivibrio sp. INlla16]|uniref:DUF5688 family protein n=1 Tax=Butyrivibrio sp. INlla16 TaxID=1520807 RepID=UPI00088F2B96|nr:DUF5688 family protein [Butyrivibrio sp. INlla16]SDB68375.1 hypothetical protein SAMN02910263_04167 [Butyrivibrio sp. INlla16]
MNITTNLIIEELGNRGYVVEEATAIKNGITKHGVTVRKSREEKIAPTVYTEDMIERAEALNMTVSDVCNEIERIVRNSHLNFDIEQLYDRDFILEHIRLGLQKKGTEEIVKRASNFDGLEEYLYLSGTNENEQYSIKVKKNFLRNVDIAFNIAWATAQKNSFKETTIQPLMSVIEDMTGERFIADELAPIYVISNSKKFRGASAITDHEAIKELAENIGVNEFVILPSSIHECILMPKTAETDMDYLLSMVKEVNKTTVAPEERLIDAVFELTA